jgi:hypothetical protein
VTKTQEAVAKGKRSSKLERLRAQGQLVGVKIDGQTAPYFALPTPELQAEWNEELGKKIKHGLKASGFELLHATRREHPFHSALLLERLDVLARDITVIDHKRGIWSRLYMAPANAWKLLTEKYADWPEGMQAFRSIWAKAYEDFQDMRRSTFYWRGTPSYDVVFPANGPALPDGPRPKPVFVSKRNPNLVLALGNGFVNMWMRR